MAKKTTKARAEYRKARANYLRNIRNYLKRGIFENAPIPELAPKRTKAKDLNRMTRELKKLNRAAKAAAKDISEGIRRRKKEQQNINLDTEIVEQYLEGLKKGVGGRVVASAVERFIERYGVGKVSQMLQELESEGNIITNAIYYDVGTAQEHVAKMERKLFAMGVMEESEMVMTERLQDQSLITDEELNDIYGNWS